MCSNGVLCLPAMFMRQFPKYDPIHVVLDSLDRDYPICNACAKLPEPRHIICSRSFNEGNKLMMTLEKSLVDEYIFVKEMFKMSQSAREDFVRKMN